ncbi:Tim44/TimA family putative adaptor protein [Novosphingobium sp.]|uniref:Tim44/TimA family putative adaptor protein n=1 Tax=Novosphingobium sp. TaxID=1874826 RepID=UPI0025E73DFF|nr:Tim44/TimA family putative adaptor protein [Novosphingobium sp.]
MDKTVEIVILAMVAAFLGLRLYSVLGRRAEHEERPVQPRFEPKADTAPRSLSPEMPASGPGVMPPRALVPGVTPAIERGLKEIAAADRRFDMLAFLDSAKAAYRMVLEAFWKGDKEALAHLCDPAVLASFTAAIDAREAAGEQLANRLVRIEEATIAAASFQAPTARITVRFLADIAALTRNAEGVMIAGSLDDAIEARDMWTFSRNTAAASPDWLLDETDEG